MFYKEIRTKKITFLTYQSAHKYSVLRQIRFNGNVFGNICCRCNEGSLS